MKIEPFEMERMQSTWENLVEYDMSESGVRPLTLRELGALGFDIEHALDLPLGYSQSNGTLELREKLAALYPGAKLEQIEVTNGTSEANYLLALSLLRPGDEMALEVPNYMQLWGVPRSLGATINKFHLDLDHGWEPDWDEFHVAVTPKTRLVYVSNPNNPTGAVLSSAAMQKMVEHCESVGAYLLADEVYQGAEIHAPRTPSFWGMSDRVIVTSGLSKAYGIPGVRIGWIVGPAEVVAECWTQHDYLTIGPNKLSDWVARTAVEPRNREKCYARTREILQHNLPAMQEWIASFSESGGALRLDGAHGFLEWREPVAGAMALIRYGAKIPSYELCEQVRQNQSTLIVPGIHLGLEGHIRVWMGGRPEYLAEGLRRVGEELRKIAI